MGFGPLFTFARMDYGPFWETIVEITPIKPTDVQLATHMYQSFGATLPKAVSKKEITNPAIWVNAASKMQMGAEIRVTDYDNSFMARLFVTFASGHDVRLKLLEYHVFEAEDVPAIESKYFLRQRGQQKWCIMDKDKPDPVFHSIPTKHEAEKKLHEYKAALAR